MDDEPVPLESVVGGSIRGNGWLVEPGRYTTDFGSHRFTFTITEPVVWIESNARITFRAPNGAEGEDLFVLTNYAGVIPPERASEHAPHHPLVPTYAEAMPENLGDWMTSVGQLTPGEQMDLVGEGGVEAMAWDVAVDISNGGGFDCPRGNGECVSGLANADEGVYIFWEGSSFRLWQFGGTAEGVYGFLQSRTTAFEDTVGLADMIIQGMTVEPAA